MSKETIKEMLEMMDAKIEHIEDITADDRALIIKLVKQGNEIVQFLRNLQIDEIEAEEAFFDKFTEPIEKKENKLNVKALVEEFMDKRKDLKELEEELKKHKEMLTPGQIGEA
tara:strand:+ start:1604 stop:1942 length:339 start_codon:yes stop_codon:yes gene_type:complete